MSGLTARQLYEFDLAGYVILKGFLSPDQVRTFNEIIDASAGANNDCQFPFLELNPIFMDLLSDPRVLAICEELLGPYFRFDHAYGLQRDASTPESENLHAGPLAEQGMFQYQWGRNGRPHCGLIVFTYCLEAVKAGEGGLVLVPGSHKQNVALGDYAFTNPPGWQVYHNLLEHRMDAWWIHNPALEPGDLLLFTEATVHGSIQWQGTVRRRNLYYKYAPGYMAWRPWAEIERYLALARNDVERQLLRPPYVGMYDETTPRKVVNHYRVPTRTPHLAAIARVVINDVAPAREASHRLDIMRRIIESEPRLDGTIRAWILSNLIHDDFREGVIRLLREYGESYWELPFNMDRFLREKTAAQQARYVMSVNVARNYCMHVLREQARCVFILDDDCMIDAQAWPEAMRQLEADLEQSDGKDVWLVPMDDGEPQVILRNDCTLRFDEARGPFGDARTDFLNRSGWTLENGHWNGSERGRLIGRGVRLSSSTPGPDELNRLVEDADRLVRRRRGDFYVTLHRSLGPLLPLARRGRQLLRRLQGWFR